MGQTQSLSQLSETNVPEERKRMERADNPATAIDQPWRRWGCYLSDVSFFSFLDPGKSLLGLRRSTGR
jgi:hypothetical protein